MDVHDAWIQGKSISEIARQTGRDRKTIRRLPRVLRDPPTAKRLVPVARAAGYTGSARNLEDPVFRPHSSLGYLAPAMFAALLLGKLPTPELQTR